MIKAILFDKDGTLIDFEATFAPATANVIEALAEGQPDKMAALADAVDFDLEGLVISPGSQLVAGSLDNIVSCWTPHMPEDHAALLARVDALYVQNSLESLAPVDRLTETLGTLMSRSLQLGVATNDSHQAAHAHLDQLSIAHMFGFVVGFDSGFGEKPQPGMVEAFINHCGLSPDEIAMVGDSVHDCAAGRAAGAVAIGLTTGLATQDDLAPHADHILPALSDLPELIDRM
ncbi:MAG: HAD family hydrolase [Ahrensia sp.]|nr:HAD family hydrolase [Ahrensia sp.]